MRVISPKRLREFWGLNPEAEPPLRGWLRIAKRARWRSLVDVRRDFPHADATDDTKSGRMVTIFNIGGGKYRLVTAMLYESHKVLIKRAMTHAEYDKENWKRQM